MKSYLLSAAGVIFLSVIVTLLIPEGKLNKSVTFVMRIICILVLIRPLGGIFNIDATVESEPMYDYEYICEVYSDFQSRQLESSILQEFASDCYCDVEVVYDDGQFIIEGVTVEINGDDKNLEDIYAYLEQSGYINISVYAKSN